MSKSANRDMKLVSPMMFYPTATLIVNSVGKNKLRKTRTDNSEPAHNMCFRRNSTTNRVAIAPADHGNELDGPNPGKSFEYEYAAAVLSGAIFPSPSKDTKFYAGCRAMQLTQPALTKAVKSWSKSSVAR